MYRFFGCENTSISPVFFQPYRIVRCFRWWLNNDYVLQFTAEMNVHDGAKKVYNDDISSFILRREIEKSSRVRPI